MTVFPFQIASDWASSGRAVTFRAATVATGPLPTKRAASGAASATSPPIDSRRSTMTFAIWRRCASSRSLRTAATAAALNDGILRMATSRSHLVDGAGGSNLARDSDRVRRFSSPPRKSPSSHVEPSGPSSAAWIFHSGALRSDLPSTESRRSPAFTPAFCAGDPGSGATT